MYNAVAIPKCDLPIDANANAQRLGYIWVVHVGEAIGLLSLIYGILPLSKAPRSLNKTGVSGGGSSGGGSGDDGVNTEAAAAVHNNISDGQGSFSNRPLRHSSYAVSEENAVVLAAAAAIDQGGANSAAGLEITEKAAGDPEKCLLQAIC